MLGFRFIACSILVLITHDIKIEGKRKENADFLFRAPLLVVKVSRVSASWLLRFGIYKELKPERGERAEKFFKFLAS